MQAEREYTTGAGSSFRLLAHEDEELWLDRDDIVRPSCSCVDVNVVFGRGGHHWAVYTDRKM